MSDVRENEIHIYLWRDAIMHLTHVIKREEEK